MATDLGTPAVVESMRASQSWRPVIEFIEDEARADERRRWQPALQDALDGLEEMLPYCDDYFRQKWNLDGYLVRARGALFDLMADCDG